MGTFVLIPGAGGDPWEWYLLARELEARGHEALPVRLPAADDSAGWAEYAGAVVDEIGDRQGVVLVAQSLAGFTAPLVAEGVRVDLIVLINTMIPLPGETGNQWWANTRRKEAEQAYYTSVGLPPETSDDEVAVYMHDVPPEVAEEAANHLPGEIDDSHGAAVAPRLVAERADPRPHGSRRSAVPGGVPAAGGKGAPGTRW